MNFDEVRRILQGENITAGDEDYVDCCIFVAAVLRDIDALASEPSEPT